MHLFGLLSDGGVHSHQRHLHALLDMAARRGVSRVFVHAITDGRDTSPTGGRHYWGAASRPRASRRGGSRQVVGRYYAMDRDKRWDRTSSPTT
jgi:2,3-bisphosphoglycerate-independent phosphoglycerate mutase